MCDSLYGNMTADRKRYFIYI